jgi:transcriptional regulator with XRE-family HTH domain
MSGAWKIKEWRNQRGLTQEALANRARSARRGADRISRQLISEYECGKKTNLGTDTALAIADALAINLGLLLKSPEEIDEATPKVADGSTLAVELFRGDIVMVPTWNSLEAWHEGEEPTTAVPISRERLPHDRVGAVIISSPHGMPTIVAGDSLLLNRERRAPHSRQVVVCMINGRLELRRFRTENGQRWLELDAYPGERIPAADVEILATVCGRFSPEGNL